MRRILQANARLLTTKERIGANLPLNVHAQDHSIYTIYKTDGRRAQKKLSQKQTLHLPDQLHRCLVDSQEKCSDVHNG